MTQAALSRDAAEPTPAKDASTELPEPPPVEKDAGPPPPSCIASAEVCDGKDNDCDGVADNGVTKNSCGGCKVLMHAKDAECDNGLLGECALKGTFVCAADGESTSCNAKTKSGTAEVCDGKDNDCNGSIDDNATDAVRWLRDCDDDGYAASMDGSRLACSKPAATGSCKGWTELAPSGTASTDCDDQNSSYKPGAEYGIPSGTNTSHDLNCDGKVEALATVTALDSSEILVCAHQLACECDLPWVRGNTFVTEWGEWKNSTDGRPRPSLACSKDAADQITLTRQTNGPTKVYPEMPGCRSALDPSGASPFVTSIGIQRCR